MADHNCALHWAERCQWLALQEALHDQLSYMLFFGCSALHNAAEAGDKELLATLLKPPEPPAVVQDPVRLFCIAGRMLQLEA